MAVQWSAPNGTPTSHGLSPRGRKGPKWSVSSGHDRTIVLISSAVVACTKASQHCSRQWEGVHEPLLLTGEQLTADGFWKMKESVFWNGVAPGGCSAVYILAGQTGLSELLKGKKGT